jgi:hypothetical protein
MQQRTRTKGGLLKKRNEKYTQYQKKVVPLQLQKHLYTIVKP